MFGKNVIMKVEDRIRDELAVHSIFYTIQGEGPFAGRAAVFVRLFGCSLACSWCDTDFESTQEVLSPQAILARIATLAPSICRLIVVTGGEPTRQNLTGFVKRAAMQGYTVQIETAGIHSPPGLVNLIGEYDIHLVCSPKTHKIHPDILSCCVSYKYIIDAWEEADPVDGLPKWAVSQRGEKPTAKLFRPTHQFPSMIYVQPLDPPDVATGTGPLAVADNVESRKQHAWENMQRCASLVMRHGYRLSLQQHKILDLP